MGSQRAMDKMKSIGEKLLELHNMDGSMVREDEKGCWDGALAAWKRAGMPKKMASGPENTTQVKKVIAMMVMEQYNLAFLQEVVGGARDAGREVFSEEDFRLLDSQGFRGSNPDQDLLNRIVSRAEEAASLI